VEPVVSAVMPAIPGQCDAFGNFGDELLDVNTGGQINLSVGGDKDDLPRFRVG